MVSVQSVSLLPINNVKWQIPWRTLSHLYLEGIVFMLLRLKCLDLHFIKADPSILDRNYSPFQIKLTFWEVFAPKVWPGCRNHLKWGHTHYAGVGIFLEDRWWSSSCHWHGKPSPETCPQLELSPMDGSTSNPSLSSTDLRETFSTRKAGEALQVFSSIYFYETFASHMACHSHVEGTFNM